MRAVVGDPERLAQVVDNLLSNAVRYTDPGGRVAVALEAGDDEVVVSVADSGIGIAPEQRARIFDRFWRSPEARERTADGSGVGLAVVSELVDVHDGRVAVESVPGRGTTFSVFLPARAPAALPVRRAAPAPEPLAPARRRGREPAAGRPGRPLALDSRTLASHLCRSAGKPGLPETRFHRLERLA